jgi:hypothetical protein
MAREMKWEALRIAERIIDQVDEILYENLAGEEEKLANMVRSLLEGHTIV